MSNQQKQAIEWQPDFATGVAIIDDQHRVLIKMLNQASVELTDYSPLSDLERIVQGLLNYAGYHFQTEEKLMAEHGYDKDSAPNMCASIRILPTRWSPSRRKSKPANASPRRTWSHSSPPGSPTTS